MMSRLNRRPGGRWLWMALLAAVALAQESVKTPPAHRPSPAEVSAAIGDTSKNKKNEPARAATVDPPLEAILRGWRRHGIAGAEHESAAQNIKLDRLRVPGVIHLVDEKDRGTVLAALHHAWGESSAVEENRIYALIPVPALRRISAMQAVHFIYLDRPMRQADGPIEEHAQNGRGRNAPPKALRVPLCLAARHPRPLRFQGETTND
jgi:hypothetical protein